MATARYAWGIDIGNRALKAIRVVRVGESLKIDDFDIIEHEQILSNAGDNREAFITASLANFVQRHNLKSSVVSVGVSGQASFARFIKLPPVEKKKIPEIVKFEAIQQIPFPLEDVEWTYQLFESPETPDVEVGIFAMRKELVSRHLQFFTDVDMKVAAVQMNPLAVYNAMQFDGRVEQPTMIIDMGAENTDLIIADNNSVWLRSIPIGGNSFTETLVKAFKLDFVKAEKLKREAGTSKYTRQIFQTMRPVFADLVGEIQRSVGFFSSVRRETRIGRVIALGGTFRLPNLLRYLQQNLQLEVERMDSFKSGAPTDAKQAAAFNENLLSLAGAYGLAIQAMGEGKIQSSLLPASIRRERMWKEKTKWFGTAAALMVAGTGLAYGSIYLAKSAGDLTPGQGSAGKNDTLLRQANDFSRRWGEIENKGAPDRDLINYYFSLNEYRTLWANLLVDIRKSIPEPQAEVKQGLAEWNATKLKSIPRGQRNLLLLDDLSCQYVPNMDLVLNDPDFRKYAGVASAGGGEPAGMRPMGGPPPGMPHMGAPTPAAGGATAPRGLLITVHCTTPFANGPALVQSGFVANLLKINVPYLAAKRYVVAKATIISAQQLEKNPNRLAEIAATYSALSGDGASRTPGMSPMPVTPGGMPPRMPGMMAPPAGMAPGATGAEAGVKYLDPLTDEDVTKDWEFTVLFAVVIDPPANLIPTPASAPAAGAAPAGN